jgi:hypothetical protein
MGTKSLLELVSKCKYATVQMLVSRFGKSEKMLKLRSSSLLN